MEPNPGPGPAYPNLKEKNHKEFSIVVKNIKDCSKVRNNGACANLLFFKNNKLAVISNLLAFFLILVDKFTLLDPDPQGKMNADPCRSVSTALLEIGLL